MIPQVLYAPQALLWFYCHTRRTPKPRLCCARKLNRAKLERWRWLSIQAWACQAGAGQPTGQRCSRRRFWLSCQRGWPWASKAL